MNKNKNYVAWHIRVPLIFFTTLFSFVGLLLYGKIIYMAFSLAFAIPIIIICELFEKKKNSQLKGDEK